MLALAALCASAAPAAAVWYNPPEPFSAKDFCVIKREGVYHVFYTQHDTTRTAQRNEYRFGHAISRNLWTWTEQQPVLDTAQGTWDLEHVWAPHIVESEGIYYMFYTGVTGAPSGTLVQSLGVALSTDLVDWTRQPAPIFTCSQVGWSFCDAAQPLGGDFRDPFVMQDPTQPGRWLLSYVTRLGNEPDAMVVGLASSANLSDWQDQGPLMVTHHGTSFSVLAESPHVFSHQDVYYMVWTTNAGQPLVFATAWSPWGPWTYRGRITWMIGLNTQTWYASEAFHDGIYSFFCFANFDRLDFRQIVWSSQDDTWNVIQPDTFRVFNMYWDRNEMATGSEVRLKLEALGATGRNVGLELWEADADGDWDRLDNATYGFPLQADFTSSNLALRWVVPAIDDSDEGDNRAELVVRLSDGTLQSKALLLGPADTGGDGGTPAGRSKGSDGMDRVDFRLLNSTPLGSGPSLVVDLEAPGRVRLELFDLAGRRVAAVLDETLPAGPRLVSLPEGRRLPAPGLYFARLTTPWGVRVLRLALPG